MIFRKSGGILIKKAAIDCDDLFISNLLLIAIISRCDFRNVSDNGS